MRSNEIIAVFFLVAWLLWRKITNTKKQVTLGALKIHDDLSTEIIEIKKRLEVLECPSHVHKEQNNHCSICVPSEPDIDFKDMLLNDMKDVWDNSNLKEKGYEFSDIQISLEGRNEIIAILIQDYHEEIIELITTLYAEKKLQKDEYLQWISDWMVKVFKRLEQDEKLVLTYHSDEKYGENFFCAFVLRENQQKNIAIVYNMVAWPVNKDLAIDELNKFRFHLIWNFLSTVMIEALRDDEGV